VRLIHRRRLVRDSADYQEEHNQHELFSIILQEHAAKILLPQYHAFACLTTHLAQHAFACLTTHLAHAFACLTTHLAQRSSTCACTLGGFHAHCVLGQGNVDFLKARPLLLRIVGMKLLSYILIRNY
jgi:hypothetical protein